jgi:hypothetical protein
MMLIKLDKNSIQSLKVAKISSLSIVVSLLLLLVCILLSVHTQLARLQQLGRVME